MWKTLRKACQEFFCKKLKICQMHKVLLGKNRREIAEKVSLYILDFYGCFRFGNENKLGFVGEMAICKKRRDRRPRLSVIASPFLPRKVFVLGQSRTPVPTRVRSFFKFSDSRLFIDLPYKSKFEVQTSSSGATLSNPAPKNIDVCPRGLPRKSKFEVRAIFIYHVLDKGIFCDIIITSGSPEM